MNLTPNRLHVLRWIAANGGSALECYILNQGSARTRAMRELTTSGLLERCIDPRVGLFRVLLTDAGRSVLT